MRSSSTRKHKGKVFEKDVLKEVWPLVTSLFIRKHKGNVLEKDVPKRRVVLSDEFVYKEA